MIDWELRRFWLERGLRYTGCKGTGSIFAPALIKKAFLSGWRSDDCKTMRRQWQLDFPTNTSFIWWQLKLSVRYLDHSDDHQVEHNNRSVAVSGCLQTGFNNCSSVSHLRGHDPSPFIHMAFTVWDCKIIEDSLLVHPRLWSEECKHADVISTTLRAGGRKLMACFTDKNRAEFEWHWAN